MIDEIDHPEPDPEEEYAGTCDMCSGPVSAAEARYPLGRDLRVCWWCAFREKEER